MTPIAEAPPAPEHVFRDTRPFAQCHAPTVVLDREGEPGVAFFAGSHEGHPDCAIWYTRRRGAAWQAPRLIAKVRDDAHWNPVLFDAPDGRLHLHFKVGTNVRRWETWHSASDDGGESWSAPSPLVPGDRGGRGAVKNKPIALSDGSWLAGGSLERWRSWRVFVDRSEDEGRSWQRSALLALDRRALRGKGVIQPSLWESRPGRVHMLMRSTFGRICRSDSEDAGRTWSPITPTDLPNNNSGLDLVSLGDGRIVLAYNPVAGNRAARTPLRLSLSEDEGRSFVRHLDLEVDPGEFSYPAIVRHGERLAVAYTWNRRRIAYWQGGVDDLT